MDHSSIYKCALDNSFDGILISDAQGNVIYVNEQYEVTTGLSREIMVGRNLSDLLREGIINRAISLEVIKTKQSFSTMHSYVSGKSAMSSATPIIIDGELVGVVNNTRNIEKLLELEHQLIKSEEETRNMELEMRTLKKLLNRHYDFVCISKTMREVINKADMAAPFDSTILIQGESGTGKEVIARHIHNNSPRKENAFIRLNCAAIPRELFESELFGYEKGAFTGAKDSGKIGLFELANRGTLLLDEIGDLPLEVQSKLLRVIQEKEIHRVGGEKTVQVDVRIIAATNRDLQEMVQNREFREDLYFRLSVFPIQLPPLRDRRDDIVPMIQYFLEKLNSKNNTTKTIESAVLDALENYSYPGNVRELENIVEYLFIISRDHPIRLEYIPGKVLTDVMINNHGLEKQSRTQNLAQLVKLYEKTLIEDTISRYKTLETASKVMGIHPSTLSRKMKSHRLKFD
ncbi:MAG: sigma 54-interacting transcriptional regulator [Tissierellia bacterium]|nr:sigma 54-interacting transcriptional regulator [Tissierellia bacterium]